MAVLVTVTLTVRQRRLLLARPKCDLAVCLAASGLITWPVDLISCCWTCLGVQCVGSWDFKSRKQKWVFLFDDRSWGDVMSHIELSNFELLMIL